MPPSPTASARALLARLDAEDVRLPSGDRLTSRRFQQIGGWPPSLSLMSNCDWKEVLPFGSNAFLHDVEGATRYTRNPIYATLHESSYADGVATRWSAERLLPEFPGFDLARGDPVPDPGEMIYPWMFDTYPRVVPLKGAAELLAQYDAWPALYDVEKLRGNTVPVAAAVYYDDMYVHREFSEETARIVPNMKLWITNEYEHNALRADGEKVVGRLLEMVRGG